MESPSPRRSAEHTTKTHARLAPNQPSVTGQTGTRLAAKEMILALSYLFRRQPHAPTERAQHALFSLANLPLPAAENRVRLA